MTERCAECGGVDEAGRTSILANVVDRPICLPCRRKLQMQFAAALAILGLGVAVSPVLVKMPIWLFEVLGGGLVLVAGLVYWRTKRLSEAVAAGERASWLPSFLARDAEVRFYGAIFGTWFLAYYAANLACGEWNPLAVGCNDTCRVIMWGSLGSMAALSVAYLMGYRKVAWLMLGVTLLQNYPHCQCENALFIPALRVQPFCLIVPTLVGLTNLWMLGTGRFKPIGFALILAVLAGAFAVAVTHRLDIPIAWRITV